MVVHSVVVSRVSVPANIGLQRTNLRQRLRLGKLPACGLAADESTDSSAEASAAKAEARKAKVEAGSLGGQHRPGS